MRTVRALAVVAAAAVLVAPAAAQKPPAVDDVLRAASEYATAYASRVSGVTLDEVYTLRDVSGGRLGETIRISSDLVFLNLAGTITTLRDPFAVGDAPLRERSPRITSLLAEPSAASWARAQEYAGEALRHFQATLIIRLNEPTLALQFIAPANQKRATYRLDGRRRIGGVETVGLRFQETKTKEADYIVKTPGSAFGSGRLWVDPDTGRIHRTELIMQSSDETGRITVDYAHDASLDLGLPSATVEQYEMVEHAGSRISNMGAGSSGIVRQSFECRVSYSNPRLTPIDLSGSR